MRKKGRPFKPPPKNRKCPALRSRFWKNLVTHFRGQSPRREKLSEMMRPARLTSRLTVTLTLILLLAGMSSSLSGDLHKDRERNSTSQNRKSKGLCFCRERERTLQSWASATCGPVVSLVCVGLQKSINLTVKITRFWAPAY